MNLSSLFRFRKNFLSKANKKMDQSEPSGIIIYGTEWCGDTRRARKIFDLNGIPYKWVDINKDAEACAFVERTNRGYRSVPTIVFPDGTILVEPSNSELNSKLGLP